MTWLNKQSSGLLQTWLGRTDAAMLASKPCGEILWCNRSFERLLGYTAVELIGKITWKDLTDDDEELHADEQLVTEMIAGERNSYQLHKQYQRKNSPTIPVVIDVLRYPQHGDFECFLVTVFPIDRSVDFTLGQLEEFRSLLLEIIKHQPHGLTFAKVHSWAFRHPYVATVIGILLSVFLFGDRVLEIIARIVELKEAI